MNAPHLPPALRAAAAVARPILGIASALVGLSALAYLIGWRETSTYYSAFGAQWVTALLGPTRLMQSSAWVIWITLTFAFTSVYSIAAADATHRGMRWWAILTLVAGIAFWIVDAIPLESITFESRTLLSGLGAILFAVSAGLTIAEVVARYKEDGFRWRSYHLWLLFFVVILTFVWAPARMGEARARLNMASATTALPIVELATPDTTTIWRLLEVTDSSAVLVALGATAPKNRFRVVGLAELRSIGSTTRAPK